MLTPLTAGDILLRQVPGQLLSGVQAGELHVYGSIIRSLTSGRIVGHLQETAALSNIVATGLSAPATLPLQAANLAVDAVGHGVSYVQNEQIKAAIAVLENLQIANLAVGAIGIGVSVAGFAILSSRISQLEVTIDSLGERLDSISRGIAELRRDRIADHFTRLETISEQLDEGWRLADPVQQWQRVATDAHGLAKLFERQTCELLDASNDIELAEPFIEALGLAVSTRIHARMAAGDDQVARMAAEDGASAFSSIEARIRLMPAAIRRLSSDGVDPASKSWSETLQATANEMGARVSAVRQRTAAVASTGLTLAELELQGVRGRDWLEAARSEEESPLLCLVPCGP